MSSQDDTHLNLARKFHRSIFFDLDKTVWMFSYDLKYDLKYS